MMGRVEMERAAAGRQIDRFHRFLWMEQLADTCEIGWATVEKFGGS